MSGLVGYTSSDEEDEQSSRVENSNATADVDTPDIDSANIEQKGTEGSTIPRHLSPTLPSASQGPPATSNGHESSAQPLMGPAGPLQGLGEVHGEGSMPSSPYTVNRTLLRELTMPSVPNFDIPPSPPGSPVPATSKKFAHFLELKKQGVHFNEKLATSSALKNPSLLEKLMGFAEVDGKAQYGSTLSKELWDPSGFPRAAYKEQLAKSQQDILKRKEEEKARIQREAIDFVPPATGDGSRGGLAPRSSKGSAAERVMAGLERGKSRSPQVTSSRFDKKTR